MPSILKDSWWLYTATVYIIVSVPAVPFQKGLLHALEGANLMESLFYYFDGAIITVQYRLDYIVLICTY